MLVSARSIYLEEQSAPIDNNYVWAYHIVIHNLGESTVQLRARTWRIVDSNGHIQNVHGAGVVGELPFLKPNGTFEYTSGTSLTSPSGVMSGFFHMLNAGGEAFDATIPSFSLDSPHQFVVYN
ncbi:MAG: Co2+/Mg2+ efflux protein ApaG [Alphaproteobacteria bacterium 43-37]|nr:MAG: Co2+/Mg2+ efflux protein ApaG [Alphaproteobacteria bacterium 43-37]